MRLRLLPAFAALAAVTLSSCYVLPDPPPQQPDKKPDATLTDKEQQEIAEQREKKKREEEAMKQQKPEDPGTTPNPDATPPTQKPKQSAPTATPVPGKEGFVFSPFNQKIVDVREIPSGTLVADPTYPASEKKHFRVP